MVIDSISHNTVSTQALEYNVQLYGEWQSELADDGGIGGRVGHYSSIALDHNSQPHISYMSQTNPPNALNYAYRDGNGWHTQIIDDSGSAHYTSLALDSQQYPHISYQIGLSLKYAYEDNNGWHIIDLDPDAGEGQAFIVSSLALDENDYPHISYYDDKNQDMAYAYQDISGWHYETIESTGNVGLNNSISLNSNYYPHVSYMEIGDGFRSVKYAYRDEAGWHIETVEAGASGGQTSIVLDEYDYPHISYWDQTVSNRDQKYAYQDVDGWHIEVVDTVNDVGMFSSIELDSYGYPHIAYYDNTAYRVKYAYKDQTGWHTDFVTTGGWDASNGLSLALDNQNRPHISYIKYSGENLMYAFFNAPLNVPLFLQTDLIVNTDPPPVWKNDLYGSYQNQPNNIGKWGCYMTSAAMIINYYAEQGQSTFRTDPGQFNSWLRDNHLYDGNNFVQASTHTYADENGVNLFVPSPGRIDGLRNATSDAILDNSLSQGNPAILRVDAPSASGQHFVVAVGTTTVNNTPTYVINDPVYGQTTLYEQYNNQYTSIRLFTAQLSERRTLSVSAHSPVELVITDPLGRKTGYDPTTGIAWNDIPNASYTIDAIAPDAGLGSETPEEVKTLFVYGSIDGQYTVEVFGIDQGSYVINAFASNLQGEITSQISQGEATNGSLDTIYLNYDSDTGLQNYSLYLPMITKD